MLIIQLQMCYISFTNCLFFLVPFVTSANDDVTPCRIEPAGYPQRSGGLKLHLQIPSKLYPLQGLHLNEQFRFLFPIAFLTESTLRYYDLSCLLFPKRTVAVLLNPCSIFITLDVDIALEYSCLI